VRTGTLQLPTIFSIDAFYDVIDLMWGVVTSQTKTVVIDFSKLQSIEVGGVTALSNVIEYWKSEGVLVQCTNVDLCKSRDFLHGSGFAGKYTETQGEQQSPKDEFLRLELVQYDRSFSYITDKLIPWLAEGLKCDRKALSSIRVCFEEIFNNIRDHSSVNIGCSCAHHIENRNKILICISDFGVGIPARVRRNMALNSDHAAIAMACQDGFTTKTTPKNMGAGLPTLIRNIVTRNSGSVSIYSGKGIYDCKPDKRKVGVGRPAPSGYPGTVIYITIDTQKFVPSEVSEEAFSW